MPWEIREKSGKFCVVKQSDGSVVHCHDTKEKAEAQMRALYASEDDKKMSYVFGIGTARRQGKIFQAGVFPERNLEITPEDVKKAIENTQFPVPIVHDHWDSEGKRSVFDGKLGHLTKAYADPTFNTIYGESEWAEWVEDALAGEEKKVSVWFDAETMAIKSVSLTPNPRITDAALSERLSFSYNKFHSEPEETMTIEEVKKVVTDALTGWRPPKEEEKKPDPANPPVPAATAFSETPEYKAMQKQIEDERNARIKERDERIKEKALAFATHQHEDGKIVASEAKSVEDRVKEIAQEHERAQRDDLRDTEAGLKFDDNYRSRVAMIETRFKEMAPLGKDGELIGQVLRDDYGFSQKPEDVDKEVDAILSHGPYRREK